MLSEKDVKAIGDAMTAALAPVLTALRDIGNALTRPHGSVVIPVSSLPADSDPDR